MKRFLSQLFCPGSFTVLVIAPRHLVRADFAGQTPRVRRLWQSDAPMGESLPVLADAAFALGPARKTTVHVLATTCWTGVLALSSAKAATLSTLELCQALGFEAETLSNISPFDSLLAATPLEGVSGDRLFWVTQASRAELRAVADTLERRGARLEGIAHPGGLPRSLKTPPGGAWSRAELWGDSAVCVGRGEKGGLRLQVFAAFGEKSNWLHEAEAWFSGQGFAGPAARLAAPGSSFPDAAPVSHDLSAEKPLGDWLTAWACEIAGKTPVAPVLRLPSRPLSGSRRVALAGGWAALAVLLCAARWQVLQSSEDSFKRELALLKEPARRLDDVKSRTRACTVKLDESRQQLRVVQRQQDDWEQVTRRERRRHAVLLRALADLATEDFILRSIDDAAGETRVSVLSMRPELPHFTECLGAAMAPLNWRVEPPNRQALKRLPNGGPWQLDWTIHESLTTR